MSYRYFDPQNCWNITKNGTDHKTLFIVSCSIYSFFIWVSETNQTFFFKIWSDIWMLNIVEILKQKGTDHKRLLIVSCSIYSFLTWVSETIQTVFFKIRLDILMLKIAEIFQQKEVDHKTLVIASCSVYFFSCLSLWNQSDSLLQDSTKYLDPQHFSKIFTQLKIFLVPH